MPPLNSQFFPEHELIDSEEKEPVQANACNNRLNDAADRKRTDQNCGHSLCWVKNGITSFTIYNLNLCILWATHLWCPRRWQTITESIRTAGKCNTRPLQKVNRNFRKSGDRHPIDRSIKIVEDSRIKTQRHQQLRWHVIIRSMW